MSLRDPILESSTGSVSDQPVVSVLHNETKSDGVTSLPPISGDFASTYDYCLVLPLDEEKKLNGTSKGYVEKLRFNGLELFAYKSIRGDELIILMKVTLDDLRIFADKIDFIMLLDPPALKETLELGNEKCDIAPIHINHDPSIIPYEPYQHIYAKYSRKVDENLYWRESNATHPFRSLIRLKLIALMVEARKGRAEPLKMRRYLRLGKVLGYFPLHDRSKTDYLTSVWLPWKVMPWNSPFMDIKEYFGEKITLYFVFMGHYTQWLLGPALVGIPLQLVIFIMDDFSSPVLPGFSFCIALWAIVMLEFWKRREKTVALEWGTLGFESTEQDRPDFRGKTMNSVIDGSEIKHFPSWQRDIFIVQSLLVIVILICMVVGLVVSIYVIRYTLVNDDGMSDSDSQSIASLLNALQIQVMNFVYSFLAKALTDRENHRTDTQYEDSMISKLFLFQFVNSYASFFYLAFIAESMGDCSKDGCMKSLALNLAIIFGSRLFSGNLMELLLPYVSFQFKYHNEMLKTEGKMTRAEKEYLLDRVSVAVLSFSG